MNEIQQEIKQNSDTNAADKQLGFEYQFYYFLLTLLRLEKDEKAGYEVIEDVHTESEGQFILYQLKHTIQKKSGDEPKNLTTSDNDLWKTLALWSNKILNSDNPSFIQNTKFIFVSNKSYSENNKFLQKFNDFNKNNDINIVKTFLESYKNELIEKYEIKKANNPDLKQDKKINYINSVLLLKDELLNIFFKNIEFELGLDNIQEKVKQAIQYLKSIKEQRVGSVYREIIGCLKDDFVDKTKNREEIIYSGEDFYLKTLPIFTKFKSDRLPFYKVLDNYEKDIGILDSVFAKQLLDLGFDEDEIFEYDYSRNLALNNFNDLKINSEITEKDIDDLEKNTIDHWKPIFKEIYLDEVYTEKVAKKLFYKVLQIKLSLSDFPIEYIKISNGQFIHISDLPLIGWKNDWEEKYKK